MQPQDKLNHLKTAYTTKKVEDHREQITILSETLPEDLRNALMDIQRGINDAGASFDLSYDIMSDACDIVSEKTLTGNDRDSLVGDDLDFYADADSRSSVYTSVRLSYLNPKNEADISALMKDESIDSIATACAIWYDRQVAQACEALRDYVLSKQL